MVCELYLNKNDTENEITNQNEKNLEKKSEIKK